MEAERSPISRYYDVQRDEDGRRYLAVRVDGAALLEMPLLNKGAAFTPAERRLLGLDGLVAPQVSTLESQKERNYRRYAAIASPLDRHVYLRDLQDRNEVLFYALLADHLEEMLPIIYTPTVGDAVRLFSDIYRVPRGFTLSLDTVDFAGAALANVPLNDVRLAVATDSSSILGIGDQGFGGMAISIGKLSIYVSAAGVGPDRTLPIELDVGTNRDELLADPLYLGVRQRRLTGDDYLSFMDRFVEAFQRRYPRAVLQWEDFSRDAAMTILDRYRDVLPSFNDDIQGTGAMALAGLLSAARIKGESVQDQRIVILGAGSAGIGVASALIEGLVDAGLSRDEARSRLYMVDSRGLLIEGRRMEPIKARYAQPAGAIDSWDRTADGPPGLIEVIRNVKPTVLIGLSGQPTSFDRTVVDAMCAAVGRPAIFALSNPTAACEAVPSDLVPWSRGRAIVATGSPFPDVEWAGRAFPVGQGNNAFIFPGLGFGAVLARATKVTDGMGVAAAYALAEATDVSSGRVFPPISDLRDVSLRVTAAVIAQARRDGVATEPRIEALDGEALLGYVRSRSWTPRYLPYVLREPQV